MPSSISSSDAIDELAMAKGRRALLCLLGVLLLLGIALEVIALEFGHVSRIQHRISVDYSNALKLPSRVDEKPTLLLVGNSLALEGINFPEFQKDIGNDYRASRFIVEQTSYRDWYYGLDRLFRSGSRPSVVLLCLSSQQFGVERVRWNYFAHFLMDVRDFPSVVRTMRLDPTTASTYFLARLSTWIGTKTEIRNWLLVKTLPDIVKFGNLFPDLPPLAADDVVRKASDAHFRQLNELCAHYGTRLLFAFPPNLDTREPVGIVEEAGRAVGITVLAPYRPGELQPQYFRDGYHLNDEGALLFTPRLAAQVRQAR